ATGIAGQLKFQMTSETPPTPPQLIPLRVTRRVDAQPASSSAQVRSPKDLLRRLFVGDLDPVTFSFDRGGWTHDTCHRFRIRLYGWTTASTAGDSINAS